MTKNSFYRSTELDIIFQVVCSHYGVELRGLMGSLKCRKRELVLTRQFIMYFALIYTSCTFKEAGYIFFKDHATAIHGKNTIENLKETDRAFNREYHAMNDEIISRIRRSKIRNEVECELKMINHCEKFN